MSAAVKKETSENSLKFSTGPSHSVSEIGTSHVCRLKKTRGKDSGKLCVF